MREAGATPIDGALDIVAQPRDTGNANGHRITVWPVLFDGILTVEDPGLLRQAIVAGIGPARAYGNGLLSLALVR
jgi:CRISPR system Cascade subunit CasE